MCVLTRTHLVFFFLDKELAMVVAKVSQLREVNDYIQRNSIVLIDAYSEFCGPCLAIAPRIEALSKNKKYADVQFLKFDVDESEELATEYNITAMPTFIFIKDGKIVERIRGADYRKIVRTLDTLVA